MKTLILLIGTSLILSIFSFSAEASSLTRQDLPLSTIEKLAIDFSYPASDTTVTKKFRVYGNCGMCKNTIEGSLENVEGMVSADWNKENDTIKVVFTPSIITLDQIKQKIADVGYDSDSHRADEATYNALPGCCQYARPE